MQPRGAIDDRAIHVNATSTRTRLFGAVWDAENRSMTGFDAFSVWADYTAEMAA